LNTPTRKSSSRPKRLVAYLDKLAEAAGHLDRAVPVRNYCRGLLLPGERKSVEPMAARLAPDNVRRMHQSLHHLVADAPWSDEAVLRAVRGYALTAMRKREPVVAWIVDDTGFPKKGTESVGVTRQYCGQLGKQENCRVAVSLSVSTWTLSVPIAYRLYLPESWANDHARRKKTGVPAEIQFQTKPRIALDQIRQAVEAEVPCGVVLADAAYGNDSQFRAGLRALQLEYAVGVQSSVSVWEPGKQPLPAKPRKDTGRPPKLLGRDENHQPVSAQQWAFALPETAWKQITWREGSKKHLRSRFAAARVRSAHRDYWQSEPNLEEWLLIEWPKGAAEPAKYWLSNLPAQCKLEELVRIAKQRWIVERDYEELKQELGLGHFEGRGWRGFHHHATLCLAVYGFLVAERSLFSPSLRAAKLELPIPNLPTDFQPRGASRTLATA
jgi:SRSO17 transposase